MKLIVFVALALLVLPIASAETFVYDDFSGSALDATKWQETTVDGFVDEHFIDTTNHIYHVAQTFQSGGLRNIVVKAIGHNFSSGENLDFDFDYVSSSGNRAGYFLLYNGNTQTATLAEFGYWNGEFGIGNMLGQYHYTIEFVPNQAIVNITKPDNTILSYNVSTSYPILFVFSVNNGHNGMMHFDYDNFIITTSSNQTSEDNETSLEERVAQLEQQVAELTDKNDQLMSQIQDLQDRTTTLESLTASIQNTLDSFIDQIIGLLSNADKKDRKNMICGYMKDNSLTSYTALGLACNINSKGLCSCK